VLTVETEPADKFTINRGDILNTLFELEMIYDIQGVLGGMCQTSGECSLS